MFPVVQEIRRAMTYRDMLINQQYNIVIYNLNTYVGQGNMGSLN